MKAPVLAAGLALAIAPLGFAAPTLYWNDTPNALMAMGSRPSSPGILGIEAADDFVLASPQHITSGTFTGLVTPGGTVSSVGVEFYRIFPFDSVTPASGQVPTRTNSPADVAYADGGLLSFSSTTLATNFTAANSVLNGLHPVPGQTTGGDGAVTGNQTAFSFTLTTPVTLPAGHYFFVPQVGVTGGDFYWLSASRPISGSGTTPFAPDLQTWMRNDNLAPDWLRVGTDVVGGASPPTFNAAFSLNGTAVPDTVSTLLLFGLAGLGLVVGAMARVVYLIRWRTRT